MELKSLTKYITGILLVVLISFSTSCSYKFDQETFLLKKSADASNQEGLTLMDEGKYEEALSCFNESLKYAERYDGLKDSPQEETRAGVLLSDAYNNLCYAYNSLGEYDLSLENGEKAVNIEPNDDYEYSNMGNALIGLSRYEEAIKYYDLAIEKDANAEFAYYGKGNVYFDTFKYEDALEMFNKYRTYKPVDLDAILYIVYSHIHLNNYDEALKIANKAMSDFNDRYELYEAKGEILSKIKSYEETKAFYELTIKTFPDNMDAQILLGEFYYNKGQYQLALEHFLKLAEAFSEEAGIDSWIINCCEALEETDRDLEFLQKFINEGMESAELYNAIGNMCINKNMNMESIQYFEKAIRLALEEPDAYISITYALFYGKRYSKCIEFGKQAQDKFSSEYDLAWYIGDSYFNLCNYEEAILQYHKVLELDPENNEILSYIGNCYLMLEDYENAKIFADRALALNTQNATAIGINETISERKKPVSEQLKTFFKDNYLYYEESNEIENRLNELLGYADLSNLNIAIAMEKLRETDDFFTFVLFDEEYDFYSNDDAEDVEHEIYDDIVYLRIYGFNNNTDNKVIEFLDTIKDSEHKTLAIDLRGNGGGITQCANNMLDALLPEYVTSTLIDRGGYTYNFFSDASQIKFDKIFILVDEYSASASELLTMGLKTYLNNVTIIGRNTYGKGVGQVVYENRERKLMLFLVNSYWNVRQKNIMSTTIEPDIYIPTNDLEDYLKIIKG